MVHQNGVDDPGGLADRAMLRNNRLLDRRLLLNFHTIAKQTVWADLSLQHGSCLRRQTDGDRGSRGEIVLELPTSYLPIQLAVGNERASASTEAVIQDVGVAGKVSSLSVRTGEGRRELLNVEAIFVLRNFR